MGKPLLALHPRRNNDDYRKVTFLADATRPVDLIVVDHLRQEKLDQLAGVLLLELNGARQFSAEMRGLRAARRILRQTSELNRSSSHLALAEPVHPAKFTLDRIPQPFVGGPEFTSLELRQGEIVRVVCSG
jgi:hypothetical protein